MAIIKQYPKNGNICKVTFKLSKEQSEIFTSANLVGDFNNWDTQANMMKRSKSDGTFSISLELEKNQEYQFRYLLDQKHWTNDDEADRHVPTHFGDSENSVLDV